MSNTQDLIVEELKKEMIMLEVKLRGAKQAYHHAKIEQFEEKLCKHLQVPSTYHLSKRVIVVDWSDGKRRYIYDSIRFAFFDDEPIICVYEINKKGVKLKTTTSLETKNGSLPPDSPIMSLEP